MEQEIGLSVGSSAGSAPQPSTPGTPVTEKLSELQKKFNFERKKTDFSSEIKGLASKPELLDAILAHKPEDFLPWEDVTLPSLGLFYDGRIPEGVVKVRPMGLIADKILATQRLAQSGQSIDYIMKNCLKLPDPDFDHAQLLTGDRIFLLWYLRGITHGNTYEFTVTCTRDTCKAPSVHQYDLNELAQTIRHPKVSAEPLRIVLPGMSASFGTEIYVETRFSRWKDIQVMGQIQKTKDRMLNNQAKTVTDPGNRAPAIADNRDEQLNSTVEESLSQQIMNVNGNVDRMRINKFIKLLTATDTAHIREEIKSNEPGIDPRIQIICPECQNEMLLDLPFTESFFRPAKSGVPGS